MVNIFGIIRIGAGMLLAAASLPGVCPEAPAMNGAVICGVSDYQSVNNLTYCDDDALAMRDELMLHPEWAGASVQVLIDSQASHSGIYGAILNVLDGAQPPLGAGETFLFYFSGHGSQIADRSGEESDRYDEAICPWDAQGGNPGTFISDDTLALWLAPVVDTGAHVIVIVDSCFGGGMAQVQGAQVKSIPNPRVPPGAKARRHFGQGLMEKLNGKGKPLPVPSEDLAGQNCVALMACAEKELSYEYGGSIQHGIFTSYLLDGLAAGLADADADGTTSAEELFAFAKPRVAAFTNRRQNPRLYDGDPSAGTPLASAVP
jgi:uncharacterized caspase-like protein